MGISMKQLNKQMKKGAIKSATALPILLREMNKEYGGATQKQAQTFNGMLANLKEGAKYTLGIMFKPLFAALKKDVFPALNLTMGQIQSFWSDQALTTKQKLQFTAQSIRTNLGPLASQIGQKIKEADLGKRITDAIDYALPIIITKIGDAAPKAAKAFAKAWWEADVWGKLFIGLGLASKLGIFSALGRSASDKFVDSFIGKGGKGGGLAGEETKGRFKTLGKGLGAAIAVGIILGLVLTYKDQIADAMSSMWEYTKDKASKFGAIGKGIMKVLGGQSQAQITGRDKKQKSIPLPSRKGYTGLPGIVGHQQSGGWASGWNIVGERGPELVKMPNRSYVYPTGTMPPVSMPSIGIRTTVPVIIRNREIARAVADDTADVMART
jgi:hypothetical protein